ncbi:GNAT family N-acetyltransferase [Microbispora sp. SCL1-1]|uniref:bifunctional acetate--CoA ligase family protein/GNAT family N-acetyltransferase n=1 Tax=unclassified Microbispora TaxID=2614687 RepID=UPI001157B1C5|nr:MULTISPECIES: GNAT family N-acetyltransferase [unclassified Microbispora]NJP25291.1 GNAT family N-acetyltransferase [Microbispora sp. CL1-1]TQS13739.1 GNAT family N-acetyltransferase [Microbispora sp. SCL1-1]
MVRTAGEACDVLLRDGGVARIRPLRPADREALHELIARSSPRSAYMRFFTGGAASAHAYMDRITGPGYHGHALVALVGGRVVGVAEYIADPDGSEAEVGILLDDAVHGCGLGTLLLEHLALDAADEGIEELVATVLPQNRAMLRVLNDLGLPVETRYEDGQVEIRIATRPTERLVAEIEARAHEAERNSIARVFTPESVAVIGAGRHEARVGHRVLRNLIDEGFPGPIYAVNPRATEVCGLPAYPDVASLPGPAELAVIATPAPTVLGIARECARHEVRALVVLTSGFAEVGNREAERELLEICRQAGMRLVGPNCLGVVNTAARLNAGFLPTPPSPGPLGVMSQSGAVAAAMIERAGQLGLGISSFASVGNKADVSGNDLLEYWEDDPATRVIGLYLESFGNPRRFARIARRISARKPIIAVKSGRSAAGSRAVRSHTAAAATPDVAVDALLRACGVIREDSVQDLLDTARLLAFQPLPDDPRVAIVGNSGGPQAMTADACERLGLVVPELSPATAEALRPRLRPAAAVGNPVDLTAEADAGDIAFAIATVLADPGVDAVLTVYTPPFGSGLDATREAIAAVTRNAAKPVLACLAGHDELVDGRVPAYAFPEQAVHALARAAAHAAWRARPPASRENLPGIDSAAARRIITADLAAHPHGRWLDEGTAARLLSAYAINTAESVPVDGPERAAEAASVVGLPAVLKAVGPGLVHKSDVGGVRIGLRTPDEVRQAYREMADRLGPAMTGAIVQAMAGEGTEMIIGGVAHETFGPLIMVGLGGVATELLAVRAFRVPPIDRAEAARMIAELRCAPLLYGYRGRPAADVAALEEQIVRVGRFMDDLPDVAELDLNPVIVTPDGAVAVDCRVRLAAAPPLPSPFRRRLR